MRLASFALLAAGLWIWLRGPDVPQGSWLVMDVAGSYSEARPGNVVTRLFDRGPSLTALHESLRKVRHDGRIAGVLVRIAHLDSGWGQAEEIRSALALVKNAGKRVVAEINVELAPASKEVFIATAADAVYVAPAAAPLLTGLSAHSVFLGGVWPKLDVRMQVEQMREYKSAGEELSRESMSPAHREMLQSLLDDLHAQLVKTIAAARNLVPAEVEKAIAAGLTRPQQLVEAGIANAVRGQSEIVAELGGGTPIKTVTEEVYARVTPSSLGIGDGPSIAVVHASGPITTGRTGPAGTNAGSRSIVDALAAAARTSSISAIVLRVASPGGSPAASDEIWLAVREAAKKKPVVASLGDVAASGGYYVASAADRIVAAPGTLTGSIGVVFFKPDVSGLLARAGIHTETISRGRYARLLDIDRSFDDDELALVRAQIGNIYQLFLERVATGRRKRPEEIDRIGGGRVWTGQQAFERGLVDEVGTFNDAVRAAANAAGIHDTDKVKLMHYPRGESLAEQISEIGVHVLESAQPATVTRLAALLSRAGLDAALAIEPGVATVADGIPEIE
jgi:protease IV